MLQYFCSVSKVHIGKGTWWLPTETAFLYGDIEEAIFMKLPVGMEEIDPGSSPEDCYQLKKGIYGLCQAAGKCWSNMAFKQQKYRRQNKHIDIRTSFVKEYQEDGKIIIKFVKSEDNEADMFTKNTTNIIFQKHQEKLVWDKKEVNEEK